MKIIINRLIEFALFTQIIHPQKQISMGIRFMKKYYEIQSNIENDRIYEAKCDKKDIP